MTAEIALLNKSAVVLAADSAVTIGGGNGAKIFNTAHKIFEIGIKNPVGLMIYNNLDFMDLPWEVLAKEYRKKRKDETFETLEDWKADFIKFLTNEVPVSKENQNINFYRIIFDAIFEIRNKFDIKLKKYVETEKKILSSKLNGFLIKVLEIEISKLNNIETLKSFKKIKLSEVDKEEILTHAKKFLRVSFSIKSENLLLKFLSLRVTKEILSSNYSGLVFAGYGEKEYCPSLVHIKIDGIIFNNLKLLEVESLDIGRDGKTAEIIGFAQDDMVQNFVNGVNPQLRDYSKLLINNAINNTATLILQAFFEDEDFDEVFEGLKPHLDEQYSNLEAKWQKFTTDRFTKPVKDMVKFMPKEELANLAEALIDITSLKRKVSRDRETVGGEVDVAVISKSEGLVWIKRKHYFPAALNPRFFNRNL